MSERARAMVMASFAGDSLALGVHWIYSTRRIAEEFGRVETFLEPQADSHHSEKDRGDFTHYGDQTLVLLQSLAARKAFDLDDFSLRWRNLFEHYPGFHDEATKRTLSNFSRGDSPAASGSSSDDIAGAARIAPLVYCLETDLETLVRSARAQTAMTHADPDTVRASEFFARLAQEVLGGASPVASCTGIARDHFLDTPLAAWVDEGLASIGDESVAAIKRFGQSCHTPYAFPGIIHLIARYETDLKEALVQAVMAGGDSAARGMLVGMVLGAHLGMDALPQEWISSMKKAGQIGSLLEKLD